MAGMIELRPGATVQCGDHRYLITHLLDLESALAREEKLGRIERLYPKDLTAAQPDDPSDSIQACELSSVDEADCQTAEERFATIRPLLGDVRRTRESVAVQAQAAKVHTATVYRWLELYERTGPSYTRCGSFVTVNSLHQHKRAEFHRGLRAGHRQTQQCAVVYAGQDRRTIKI